ncbi:MAG: hypothetical protein KC548_01225, partial [Nanoarchaeota archaeon]|nr:hypothetical protein [Nanoarchaeota archaeon]
DSSSWDVAHELCHALSKCACYKKLAACCANCSIQKFFFKKFKITIFNQIDYLFSKEIAKMCLSQSEQSSGVLRQFSKRDF